MVSICWHMSSQVASTCCTWWFKLMKFCVGCRHDWSNMHDRAMAAYFNCCTHLLQENNWVRCLRIRQSLQLRRDVVVALLLTRNSVEHPDAHQLSSPWVSLTPW
jgi:hypothetical protein